MKNRLHPWAVMAFWCLSLVSGRGRAQVPDSLSLERAVAEALERHQDVLAAAAREEVASGRLLEIQAFADPELVLNWSEMPKDFAFAQSGERSIGVRQWFEFPGKRCSRIRAAEKDLALAQEETARVRILVAAVVKQAYSLAVRDLEILSLHRQSAALLDQVRRLAEIRFRTNTAPFLEVLQAKVEMTRENNRMVTLERDADAAILEIRRLTGRLKGEALRLVDGNDFVPFDRTLEQALDEALSSRASLRMAAAVAERERIRAAGARLGLLPDFSVGLFRQHLREQPPFNANGFTGTTESGLWEVDVSVSLPLWFWKSHRGRSRAASGLAREAGIRERAAEAEVESAVRTAYRAVKASETGVALFRRDLLADSDGALENAMDLYAKNKLDATTVLQTVRTAIAVREEYADALCNYRLALAALESAGEAFGSTGEIRESAGGARQTGGAGHEE